MSDMQKLIREAAERLLKNGEVICVIGWGATKFDDRTKPLFVSDPKDSEKLVWNEYCISGLSKYALDDRYPEKKLGICVRGCDSRAVNRMIMDKQLKREDVYLIGVPCGGMKNTVCDGCTSRNPVICDELLGDKAEEIKTNGRFDDVLRHEKLSPDERYAFWEEQYGKCIRCYACRNICPACSCTECYVDHTRAGWHGKQMNTAQNQVFWLTRAYHTGDRCIECGECERACPMGIPTMLQTKKILRDINDLFGDYECGFADSRTPILGEYDLSDRDDFV
jgi:ferredoxin